MHGFIAINKPIGLSSAKVTNKIKRILNTKNLSIGHTGTLDPLASGVLVIALGNATRFIRFLPSDKEYLLEISLGQATTTYDAEGEVIQELPVPKDYQENLKTILNTQFTGEIEQVAPKYSALKYQGKALYKYARKDIEVPDKLRKVKINKIECIEAIDNKIKLKIKCGAGVYMRSIANDLGNALNTCAYLSSLIRITCNGIGIDETIKMDSEEKIIEDIRSNLRQSEKLLSHIPKITLSNDDYKKIINGVTVVNSNINDLVCLFHNDKFIGIGKGENEILKVVRLLPTANHEPT